MKIDLMVKAFLEDNGVAHFFDYNDKKKSIEAKCIPYCVNATYDEILDMLRLVQSIFKKIDIDTNIIITDPQIIKTNKGQITEARVEVGDPDFKKKLKQFYLDRLERAKKIWVVKILQYDLESSFYECALTGVEINIKEYEFIDEIDALAFAKTHESITLSIYQTKKINLKVS